MISVTLHKEREVKHSVRYKETTAETKLGVVYIPKLSLVEAFGKFPEAIKLEMTEE